MQVTPTGDALGAEITGLDLTNPLSDQDAEEVRQAMLDHCVIFLRNQQITDHDQLRFTSYFGKPVEHVRKQRDREVKEIFIISNVKENGEPIGALGSDELGFHSDLSYMPLPGTISVMYAVEIPSVGGATTWCNCAAAYHALDDEMKEKLQGLWAVHRHPIAEQNPPEPATHPVVRSHPVTGRKSLYVSPHLTSHIVDMSESDSRELLQSLYEHQSQPKFVWSHDWQVDDLLIWDNRPTMHRREPFPDTERRIMKRTQVFNSEIPIP
jgi:taurine dioxygenase